MNKFKCISIILLIVGIIMLIFAGFGLYSYLQSINGGITDNPTSMFSSLFLFIVPGIIGMILLVIAGYITFFRFFFSKAPAFSLKMAKMAAPAYEKMGESLAKGFKKGNK